MILPAMTDKQVELAKLQRTSLHGETPEAAYWASVERDLADLLPVVPLVCRAVLDIGCGLAGIDLALWRSLPDPPDLHLVDHDRLDANPVYGYRLVEDCSAYNTWDETTAFLAANGVPRQCVHLYDAKPDELNPPTIDFALSLVSCGFHYPVTTYLPAILRALRPGGVFVLDLRRDSGQGGELDLAFAEVTVLREEPKLTRLACLKGGV